MVAGLRALLLPDEDERTDEEIAAEHEPAVNIAAISPDVWRELVRRRLSVAALGAVEARGLGGLIVLMRAAGIDVGLERQDLGPPELVLFDLEAADGPGALHGWGSGASCR